MNTISILSFQEVFEMFRNQNPHDGGYTIYLPDVEAYVGHVMGSKLGASDVTDWMCHFIDWETGILNLDAPLKYIEKIKNIADTLSRGKDFFDYELYRSEIKKMIQIFE